jgi:hypothetical protein
MEIGPYLLYSGISLCLGGISYNLVSKKEEKGGEEIKLPKIPINDEYTFIDKSLNDKTININNKFLGNSLYEKFEKIKEICNECGINNNIKPKSKLNKRLKRYIKEYQTIGHSEFIKNHKKNG